MTAQGRLLHAYRNGEAKAPATASDYANMIKAALALANVTGKPDYIERAKAWAGVLDKHYWSENLGGYYFTADDTSDLIVRPFSGQDEATPNANGTMVSNLVALYLWTGEERYRAARRGDPARLRRRDERQRAGACRAARRHARSAGAGAYRADRAGGAEHARAAPRACRGLAAGRGGAGGRGGESLPASSPAHGKTAIDGKPTAYVCIGPQCSLPVTEPRRWSRQ